MGTFEQSAVYLSIRTPVKTNRDNIDYPRVMYRRLFEMEDRHFWFRARNESIKRLISETHRKKPHGTFLEVGCGTGYVLSMIEKMGFLVTGLDMHNTALTYARRRVKGTLVHGRLESYTPASSFTAVGAFDVLEHVTDDLAFLVRLRSCLGTGGMLYLTVPSGMELWTEVDKLSGHKRRYTRQGIVKLLNDSGFEVVSSRYFGLFLYVPYVVTKKLIEFTRRSGGLSGDDTMRLFTRAPSAALHWALSLLLTLEGYAARFMALPYGTSLIIAARRAGFKEQSSASHLEKRHG